MKCPNKGPDIYNNVPIKAQISTTSPNKAQMSIECPNKGPNVDRMSQ